MKAFFDTSVLVASFFGEHPHHVASIGVLSRFSREEASCAAHSLLELYSVLTRMPGKNRASGDQAMRCVEKFNEHLIVVAMTPEEYLKCVRETFERGITGGAIYDAHIAACALKAGAQTLFTWNRRDFDRFGPKVSAILRTP